MPGISDSEVEAVFALGRRGQVLHLFYVTGDAVNVVHENLNNRRGAVVTALQFLDANQHIFVRGSQLAQTDKGFHDRNAHPYCTGAVQDG